MATSDLGSIEPPFVSVEDALAEFQAGKPLIVVDDEDRENEGDFVIPVERLNTEMLNFFLREGRGLLCAALTADRAAQLGLEEMVVNNTSLHRTNFTVSVDYLKGTTTGVSVADRMATLKALAADDATAADFGKPGHIFPLRSLKGGVLARPGHTEAAVDLCRLSGHKQVAVLIEILNEDGTMARIPALKKLASKQGLKILTIRRLIEYRFRNELVVKKSATTLLPTVHGEYQLHLYTTLYDDQEHLALVKGDISNKNAVLTRIHSECLTGNVFGSMRCDCNDQLLFAMREIERVGRGIILYMRQEGRGIGLLHKLRAYELQEHGLDTVEANLALGFKPDVRDYALSAQILKDLGVYRIRLLTNNPEKVAGLKKYGIAVDERIPIIAGANPHNQAYLEVKKTKLGHLL